MRMVVKIPSPDPAYLTLLVSGLTASLALDEVRENLLLSLAGSRGHFSIF